MSKRIYASAAAVAATLLLAACGSSSSSGGSTSASSSPPATTSSGSSAATVKVVSNPKAGTILVDANGMTLYRLSGESAGKFICTSKGCTTVWHPLAASAAAAPSGASGLGTVKRPDGTEQVTYNGAPLYTFASDTAPGQTSGQGLKDVGTWSVVAVSGSPGTSSTSSSTGAAPASSQTGGSSEEGSSKSGGTYAY